jgi:hypothetical protein
VTTEAGGVPDTRGGAVCAAGAIKEIIDVVHRYARWR